MNEVVLKSMQMGELVINVGYALIGFAVFVVVRLLMQEQESRAAQENLDEVRERKNSSFLVRLSRPFFTQYLVPIVRGRPRFDGARQDYRRKLLSAGLREEFTPDEFIAFKIFLVVFFPLALGFLKSGEFIELEPLYILLSPGVGWFYADFWLNGLIKTRQKKIMQALPFVVDLLALSTEAGLDFTGGIGKVVEKSRPGPLVDELSQFLKEMRLGASRGTALREMGLRVGLPEFNSFVAILISSDQMGASIGKILRQQSDQIRVQRILAAEKAGAAASQKIMLPLIFTVMPAVMILIFGPFVLGMVYPEREDGGPQREVAGQADN